MWVLVLVGIVFCLGEVDVCVSLGSFRVLVVSIEVLRKLWWDGMVVFWLRVIVV